MHEWFTSATESPCVATARLCYSDCVNEKTGFSGKVWFICGELCSGGELFCYLPRKKEGSPPVVPFEERFARRLFGQLAHGACQMKHCAEGEATPGPKDEHPAAAEQRRRRFNHGCFHRDLKLENVVISDDFDVMIMDYGDLYFTKDEAREARESEDAGSLPLRSIHHFEWVKRGRPKGHTYVALAPLRGFYAWRLFGPLHLSTPTSPHTHTRHNPRPLLDRRIRSGAEKCGFHRGVSVTLPYNSLLSQVRPSGARRVVARGHAVSLGGRRSNVPSPESRAPHQPKEPWDGHL